MLEPICLKKSYHPNDPDTFLIEYSVPDVRAFEQKTRNGIETQKRELRSMVGEQYHDLISAANAIITMSKTAQAIQTNFERMEKACDVSSIKVNADKTLRDKDMEKDQTRIDTKRKSIYVIASLIKSLADVPEQIWHALENHRYLHASRLYTLAKKVHEYLEEEAKRSTVDMEVAFPVIQRQWDAVSAFGPQIVQRATRYLRVTEQNSEHIAEIIVGLMLLDDLSYADSMNRILEMRYNVITDVIHNYKKSTDIANHRLAHQLREVTLTIKRTLKHIYDIFHVKLDNSATLIEGYVSAFSKTFLIPSNSSHGNETPSQSAITRLFSPSSNVHLIVRYIPEEIQNYLPHFEPAPTLNSTDIQKTMKNWLNGVESFIEKNLPQELSTIQNQVEIIQIRTKLWDLLDEDENTKDKNNHWQKASQSLLGERYYIWDNVYRDVFNNRCKSMIDAALSIVSEQPQTVVWPQIVDTKKSQTPRKDFYLSTNIWPNPNAKQHTTFSLPNFSSAKEISNFKSALAETANDRTNVLYQLQNSFDTGLSNITKDVQAHLAQFEQEDFHIKDDALMIKTYFEEACYDCVLNYSSNLETLLNNLQDWTQSKSKNEISIFLGRLARNIATLSKDLPKSLSLSAEVVPIFELRSSINRSPQYTKIQNVLLDVFHQAHTSWIGWLGKEFTKKLRTAVTTSKWNDQCPALSVWEIVEEDIRLPTQSTNSLVGVLFSVCEEIQCINSTILDQYIMQQLRQRLFDSSNEVYKELLSTLEKPDITENGALQMLFDHMFLSTLFHDVQKSANGSEIVEKLQNQVHSLFCLLLAGNNILLLLFSPTRLTRLIGRVTNHI
ncbi:unnamed protein product [Mucor hiemalis]